MEEVNGNRSRQIEETVSREKRKTHTRKKKEKEKLEKGRTKLHDLIFAFLSLSPWKGCHVRAREAIKSKKCIPSEKLVAAAKRQSTRKDE